MKKKTIWFIAVIMGFSFIALLLLQLKYMDAMVKMKKEQLDESVNKALYQAARNLELNETLKYLERDVNEIERRSTKHDSTNVRYASNGKSVQHTHQYTVSDKNGNVYTSFELKTTAVKPSSMPKAIILRTDKNSISEATKSMREIVKNRYVYQKALLDEVVYNILYTASDKPLKERVNFKLLDQDLKTELMNNGVNMPYHFIVTTQDGREQYRCPDYSDDGEEYSYSQMLFRNDPMNKSGIVKIHFPDINNYIFSGIRFIIPSIAFTIVLLITFIFTIVVIFRKKRYKQHLARGTNAERRKREEERSNDETPGRRNKRRVKAPALPRGESAADVHVRQAESHFQEKGAEPERSRRQRGKHVHAKSRAYGRTHKDGAEGKISDDLCRRNAFHQCHLQSARQCREI